MTEPPSPDRSALADAAAVQVEPTPNTEVTCYYHEEVKASLLRGVLLPLAEELGERGLAVHLERHWLHGPHVRLSLRGPYVLRTSAATEAAERLRGHLATAPSRAGLDPELLLRRSEAAGRAELVPPPYGPIHPDNSVLVRDGDLTALAALLGGPGAVDCRAAILTEGTDPVRVSLDELARVDDAPAARVGVVVTAMAAHASNWPAGGLLGGYHTFLSHLEDFLFGERDARLRPRFAAFAEQAGDRYQRLVRQAIEPETADPVAAAWRAWSTRAWRIAEQAHDTGAISGPLSAEFRRRSTSFDESTALRWNQGRRELSRYHQALEASGFQQIAASREFQVYRFCTNMLYQLLALCDVAPLERYLAAHLLTEATQQIHGVRWQDKLTPRHG